MPMATITPPLSPSRPSCVSLLRELLIIWDEIGESEGERDKKLLQLEQDCLNIYLHSVEKNQEYRASLRRSLAEFEAEIDDIASVLGERAPSSRGIGSLKVQIAFIEPILEDLRLRKKERLNKLQDLGRMLIELWNQMDTPILERKRFDRITSLISASVDDVSKQRYLALQVLEQTEVEVERLNALKASKMRDLVFKRQNELEEIYRAVHMDVDSNSENQILNDLIESGNVALSDLLSSMDDQIARAKEQALSHILEKLEKSRFASEEENFLEDYERDENRYSAGKRAHKNLKRARKARILVGKIPSQKAATSDPGPIDKFVLYDQENHVSSAVWDGQERGVLRCKEHTSQLELWTLTSKQIELVEKAGFGYLRKIPSFPLDNVLISALVERWRSETNTFHLPFGEMTITLEDVGLILGLAIDGKPVLRSASSRSPNSICESLLGKAPNDLNGGMLKLACFEESGKYAWGEAALSFLYRSLGNASLRSRATISGSLTLLQCWCYFHLQLGRPEINEESGSSFPFARRWKGKQSGPRSSTNIVTYRKALDSLPLIDIQWAAYKDLDFSAVPEHIKDNLNLKASKTMLIFFDKAEKHLPNRCLRQFGFPQPIPENVRRWEKKIRSSKLGKEVVNTRTKGHSELKEWYDRKNRIVECGDEEDETEYFQWYDQITRRFVGRPTLIEAGDSSCRGESEEDLSDTA